MKEKGGRPDAMKERPAPARFFMADISDWDSYCRPDFDQQSFRNENQVLKFRLCSYENVTLSNG